MGGLSRASIVAAAIAIADAEGTEAVSMRRIARDLRVGAMSLYWYIESREELHQLMVESVQGEIEAPAPSGDWRADLRAYAGNARAAILDDGLDPDVPETSGDRFEFGLDCLLDGIAARLGTSPGDGPGRR